MICLLAQSAAAASHSSQGEDEAVVADFRAAIAEMRAELLAPGEFVEGWDRGGADPDADLRALGAETHYFLNRNETGTGVTILTDRPIADFAPAHWRIVDSYGSPSEPLDNPQVDFTPFTDRYVLGSRVSTWAQNDAGCWRNLSHALLYEIPGAPAREDDEIAPLMFRMTILAMEDQTICIRSDGDRERGYRTRYFLPDGRELPQLSSPSDLLTIIPAAPVDELVLAAPPPVPAPSQN
jgi:hypothetical protein